MRVTFLILTLSRGGAQRMLAELANGLTELGHKVTIVMSCRGIVEYQMKCPVLLAGADLITEDDIPAGDVIVSNYYKTVPVAQRASEQGKGAHIRLALCYEPAFLPNNNESFASYHLSPNLLVLSRWQQGIVHMNHGIKGRIVPIGISAGFYNMHFREVSSKLIVTAIVRKPEGGFSGHREQEYLLQQLDLIKAQHPEIVIDLITPPGEYAESSWLQTLFASGYYRLRTPSNDEELCYHYNESNIFISSSTYDSGSLPGLEAMRCGAALVTIYSGGNLEYGVHGTNCLMSYRYENRLAEDVVTLIRNKELRERLARAGEASSMQFTWERSVEIFQAELFELLSKQG
ncbi:glycosyltransferase family 4 protein [Paenibacillus sp. sgz5001063]|uniref:glycosyltransferase family 4 protein n=1 Tax=Paenibacillus sp. sgz5001063 TaxID=3242474 RepID=UPI0036D364CB